MGRRNSTDSMLEAYKSHPLSRESILERLKRHAPVTTDISELDLAIDPVEHVTDQNHIGGAVSTLRLASLAMVSPADRVLDLGCGLGGPARLLAAVYRCHVHGVDANPARIDDAKELSRLVGLDAATSFECADFLNQEFQRDYTLVWAQNAWIHIDDPARLAGIAHAALADRGRIAFEDIYLKRSPQIGEETRALAEVCEAWRSSLTDQNGWTRAFGEAGFQILSTEDDDALLLSHFETLSTFAETIPERYPEHERAGWRGALSLSRAGLLGYVRIVGQLD